MPLSSDTVAPALGMGNPPVYVTDRIVVCDEVVPNGISAVVYAPETNLESMFPALKAFLGEDRTVAVKGRNAQALVDEYLKGAGIESSLE